MISVAPEDLVYEVAHKFVIITSMNTHWSRALIRACLSSFKLVYNKTDFRMLLTAKCPGKSSLHGITASTDLTSHSIRVSLRGNGLSPALLRLTWVSLEAVSSHQEGITNTARAQLTSRNPGILQKFLPEAREDPESLAGTLHISLGPSTAVDGAVPRLNTWNTRFRKRSF